MPEGPENEAGFVEYATSPSWAASTYRGRSRSPTCWRASGQAGIALARTASSRGAWGGRCSFAWETSRR